MSKWWPVIGLVIALVGYFIEHPYVFALGALVAIDSRLVMTLEAIKTKEESK